MDFENPAHFKIYKALLVLFVFGIITLTILILKYILFISNSHFEMNNPYIDLSGIKSFSFDYYSTYNPSFNPNNSNLGQTGELILDCYKGNCTYEIEYECQKQNCKYDEYGNKDCETINDKCRNYTSYIEELSSVYCKSTSGRSCQNCRQIKNYTHNICKCTHDNSYIANSFCHADNIIYNWKKYYYKRIKASDGYELNYLNSAVPADQNCPNGTRKCGILDELGNKLCFPDSLPCPINYVTLNSSDKKYNYTEYTIDNITIYYTNEATEDGRVLGGFYVDSDLMINYNIGECQIITTGNISDLLKSHENKLYQNVSLQFDPYNDENIDQKGKAYLKWCIPAVGKEKNIAVIKNFMEVYKNKQLIDEKLEKIRGYYKYMYFIGLFPFLVFNILILIALFGFKCLFSRDSQEVVFGLMDAACMLFFLDIIFSYVVKEDLSKLIDYNISLYSKSYIWIIRLNIASITFAIILIVLIFFFNIYYCFLSHNFKVKKKYEYLEDKNTTELIPKTDTPGNIN